MIVDHLERSINKAGFEAGKYHKIRPYFWTHDSSLPHVFLLFSVDVAPTGKATMFKRERERDSMCGSNCQR